MTCPTCDSNCNEFCGSMVQQRCSDCGSWWSPNTGEVLFVPERSKPAEVLELPDADGQWWYYPKDGEPAVFNVKFLDSAPAQPVFCMSHNPCLKGRYVRCIPPIVKPPVRDADLETLRQYLSVHECEMLYSQRVAFRRIAARLDRETKGAERE